MHTCEAENLLIFNKMAGSGIIVGNRKEINLLKAEKGEKYFVISFLTDKHIHAYTSRREKTALFQRKLLCIAYRLV